jgi:exonuclease SbcD
MSKKPVALLMTDTHLSKDNTKHVYNIFEQSIAIAKGLGLKRIFHLGDNFTTRQAQGLDTLIGFKKILDLFKSNGCTLITMAGNHDKTDQSIEKSYLDIFEDHESLTFFDGEDFVNKHGVAGDYHTGTDIILWTLPFFTDDVYNQKLSTIPIDPECKNILLTHIGIDGVLDNDNNKVESIIPTGRFKRFDLTFIGHYHNAQQVTKKIRYIGSTDPRQYGEDNDKGVTVLYDDLSFELIKLKFKNYVKVTVETADPVKINKLVEKHKNSDDNVRFVFNCTEEDYYKVDHEKIKSSGIDVQRNYISKTITMQDEEDEQPTASANIALTKGDMLKGWVEYCQQNKLESLQRTKGLKLINQHK